MAKIVYSAYQFQAGTSKFAPVTQDINLPDSEPVKGIVYMTYLPAGGIIIAEGNQVDIGAGLNVSSAIGPDGKTSKISGAIINAQDVTVSAATLRLEHGAVAVNTIVKGRNAQEVVTYDWAFDVNNDTADPAKRASSYFAQVSSGGRQLVSGGLAWGTTVYNGGTQIISGGNISRVEIQDKGEKVRVSSSAIGVAQNTTVLDGGTVSVGKAGATYNTIVNGGSMKIAREGTAVNTHANSGSLAVSAGGVLHNAFIGKDASFSAASGAILTGNLFIGKSFTVNASTDTADLNLCFDLGAMQSPSVAILNQNMYNNLSSQTTYSVYAAPDTASASYSIIGNVQNFNKAVYITNVEQNLSGDIYYSRGARLSLNNTVYDMFGNAYTLKSDGKNYSVDFIKTQNITDAVFSAGSKSANANINLSAINDQALYSAILYFNDENNNLTADEKELIRANLNGTITIRKGGATVSTLTVKAGEIYGEKPFISPANASQMSYSVNLTLDEAVDKDFSITVAASAITIQNTDLNDNSWQNLPSFSPDDNDKQFIYDVEKSSTITIANEYIGYGDTSDFKRFDISTEGYLNLEIDAVAINNVVSPIKITLYQAVGDGSKLKNVFSVSRTVSDTEAKYNYIPVENGVYYLEIKSDDKSFINYEATVSTDLFTSAGATGRDDSPESAAFYFADEKVTANSSFDDWAGPSDKVDYRLLDVSDASKFSLTLATDKNTSAILKAEIVKIADGKVTSLGTTSLKAAPDGKFKSDDIFVAPEDGAEYFVRVTGTNVNKGFYTDYTLSVSGEVFADADNSDDSIANAVETEIGEDSYIVKNNYIGFGDTEDYFKFDIENAGDYSFILESNSKNNARISLYRAYDDGTSEIALKSLLNSGSPASAKDELFFTETKTLSLLKGTYYLKVYGGSEKDADKNNFCSVSIKGKSYETLPVAGSIKKGEVYVLNVEDEYINFQSELFKKLTVTQDDGQNKQIKIKLTENTILAPGTYYIKSSANMNIDNGDIIITQNKDFNADLITDNNSWQDADNISEAAADRQWVGFGDEKDYYKFTVDGSNAGNYEIKLTADSSADVSIALYQVITDSEGVQSIKKTTAKAIGNTLFANNLLAGDYIVEVNARNDGSAYSLNVSNSAFEELSDGKASLDKNEYATIDFKAESDVYYAGIFGGKYTVYQDNGKGKLVKVNVYNNTAILENDKTYYVMSNANNNNLTFNAVEINPECNWLGLNKAAQSFEFDTFESGSRVDVITLDNISQTVSASTKFTMTLYRLENGSWKKVSSTTAAHSSKTDITKAGTLTVSLDADTKYKLEVATSDKGAGKCAGYFDLDQQSFVYNYDNNIFQQASSISNSQQDVVTKSGDNVNFYLLDSDSNFSLKLNTVIDSKASVKLSFYNENYELITSSVLNSSNDTFAINSAVGENVKFAKVEANGKGVNSYTIAQSEISF